MAELVTATMQQVMPGREQRLGEISALQGAST